jgi:UDP-glucose 4-epimerase
MVRITDCVSALVELARSEHEMQIVNVSTGTAQSVNHLTALMLNASDSKLKPEYKAPDWTEGSSRSGSAVRIENIFNWRATTDMGEGLEEVYNWLKQANDL